MFTTYKPQQFDLSNLKGISDETLEMHFKLYEGYVKETNKLNERIAEFIKDGSLLIILGDHQPVWEVNGGSGEFGVPVHVVSRDAELVRPFLARGYVPGVRPQLNNFNEGLEKLYPYLLVDFSTPKHPLPLP